MVQRDRVNEEGTMQKVGRFLVDQGIPAALTAGLNAAQRFGYMTLLPLNPVIEKEYGNFALLLGAAGAFVASATFLRDGWRFGVAAFLGTALAGIATASPFIFARYGVQFGLDPMHFSLVATFAYLGFYLTVGLLVGGCWSAVMKSIRDRDTPY
jgi:hypothetical protein